MGRLYTHPLQDASTPLHFVAPGEAERFARLAGVGRLHRDRPVPDRGDERNASGLGEPPCQYPTHTGWCAGLTGGWRGNEVGTEKGARSAGRPRLLICAHLTRVFIQQGRLERRKRQSMPRYRPTYGFSGERERERIDARRPLQRRVGVPVVSVSVTRRSDGSMSRSTRAQASGAHLDSSSWRDGRVHTRHRLDFERVHRSL